MHASLFGSSIRSEMRQFTHAQGMSEEEVAEAATQAAAEAASSSSLVQDSRAHGGDAQARYYNLAHRWPLHRNPCGQTCGTLRCGIVSRLPQRFYP